MSEERRDEEERDDQVVSEAPLSPRELRDLRKLMKDLDRYMFAVNLVRRISMGFAVMVGVLYGGRDIIARLWRAFFP
jgi:hypothetical protein